MYHFRTLFLYLAVIIPVSEIHVILRCIRVQVYSRILHLRFCNRHSQVLHGPLKPSCALIGADIRYQPGIHPDRMARTAAADRAHQSARTFHHLLKGVLLYQRDVRRRNEKPAALDIPNFTESNIWLEA